MEVPGVMSLQAVKYWCLGENKTSNLSDDKSKKSLNYHEWYLEKDQIWKSVQCTIQRCYALDIKNQGGTKKL